MSKPVIEFRNVGKSFFFKRDRPTNLKSLLVSISNGTYFTDPGERKTILRNVSFAIQAGETVGIMGRNGAGKSTLMRLICGIYQPNVGEISVTRRIAPMIAVGAGFHLDLSGYDNIFLNGAIIGIPRAEIFRLLPEILAFSELGEDIYRPVKHYSSGMLLRLAFSVASHVDAPILVLDEILAVGDEGFNRKCVRKLDELFESGRTVILVTHDPKQVLRFCKRCLVFDGGSLIYDGASEEGTRRYLKLFDPSQEMASVAVPETSRELQPEP